MQRIAPSDLLHSPAAAWEQRRRRQILRQGRLQAGEGGPGDHRGDILPALVRGQFEDSDPDLAECSVGQISGAVRSRIAVVCSSSKAAIMASPCSQSTSSARWSCWWRRQTAWATPSSDVECPENQLRYVSGSCRFCRPDIQAQVGAQLETQPLDLFVDCFLRLRVWLSSVPLRGLRGRSPCLS